MPISCILLLRSISIFSGVPSMASGALQYLESQQNSRPELAEWYAALADLYQRKLWHQLTLKLDQFIALAVVQVGFSSSPRVYKISIWCSFPFRFMNFLLFCCVLCIIRVLRWNFLWERLISLLTMRWIEWIVSQFFDMNHLGASYVFYSCSRTRISFCVPETWRTKYDCLKLWSSRLFCSCSAVFFARVI